MSNILVTGAGGFIGSHLVARLVGDGHNVVCLVRYKSDGSTGWLVDDYNIIRGDIRDTEFVRRACSGMDVVYQLAALIGIPYSYVAARSYVDVNVGGTLNVLEACRESGTRVIVTSTSEVYGTNMGGFAPMAEDHRIHPQSPYAASKVAADALAMSYACAFGMNIGIVRPFNTYGPRQSLRAIVPVVLSQFDNEVVRIGDGSPKRDLMYVSDTVEAFVKMGESDCLGPIHFGTGNTWSIKEVAGWFGHEVVEGHGVRRPAASEVGCLCCDYTKAKQVLGWEPSVWLDEGLNITLNWIREHGAVGHAQ